MDRIGSSSMQPPSSFFTPLLISLAGIAGTSMAIVAYHFLVVKYCIRRRRRATNFGSGPTTTEWTQMEIIGVEDRVLKTIPILSFSNIGKSKLPRSLDQSECVICLGELEEGEKVRLLPNCGHLFHVPCIDDWFSAHTSCPICRAPLNAPTNEHQSDAGQSEAAPNRSSAQFLERGEVNEEATAEDVVDVGGGSAASSFRPPNNNALLRHSVSLVLPMELGDHHRQQHGAWIGLKRSLSVDQSFVFINIQGEGQEKGSCSYFGSCSASDSSKGGVVKSSGSYGAPARSMTRLDSMSSRLLRSLSQMRVGTSVSVAKSLLPR